jgi:3-phenylpropionate/trans-cinnamate dioxygenase ferredoxin subunit
VRASRLDELEEDSPVHVDIGDTPVCLVRTGGAVYAVRDECTHQSVPLSEGEVADHAIECWLHGSRFDLATGQALSPPATRPVAVYGVRTDECLRERGSRRERADGIAPAALFTGAAGT